jgi:hypothetical protein
MVIFEVKPGGPVVFTADVEGFGSVTITSRRPGIFNGRLMNPPVLRAALQMVGQYADDHKDELAEYYAVIAKQDAA